MKYYIPTSTLNVESILTTESISPISYYAKRPFGSRFFQRISEIKSDSALYLFSKVPRFTISNSEVEQYAIAIEIDDDAQLKSLDTTPIFDSDEFSVRACYKTIVLTPWNCRIIYFDERAFQQSYLMIESSRNSKIGLRFPWVHCSKGILLKDMAAKINEDMPPDNGPDDYAFNVEKGAIWGFVFGCAHSLSDKSAKLVALSNEMRNIASNAISNSGECRPVFYTKLQNLDREYRDITDKEANDQWNQFCSSDEKELLAKFEVLKDAFYKFLRRNRLTLAPELPFSRDSKETWVRYRDALNNYTEAFVKKDRQNSSPVNWDGITIHDGHFSLVNYKIINRLLLKIQRGELTKEQIRINRASAMKIVLNELLVILKNRLGEEVWNQNPVERRYINQLYKNITDFEPFNLNSTNDDELKATAAFLLKGEDYDALVRYLEDNSIANYRLVLCLWGALEGYASIHKTLLAPVLNADNVCQVNKLLGIQKMSAPFPAEVHKPNVDAFEVFFSPFIKHCRAAEKDRMIYRRLFDQHSGISTAFVKAVATEKSLNKGNGPKKNVLKYLEKLVKPSDNGKRRIREEEQQKLSKVEAYNLFSHSIIDDEGAIEIVRTLCQGSVVAEKVIANFKFIQKEYREGGYYYKRKDSRENSDVIKHFLKLCFSTRNNFHRITHSSENDALIEKIGDELKKEYVN